MYSTSKRIVDVATARQIIAAAFGSGAAIRSYRELRDGYFNAAYQIDLHDGRRTVLKVAPPPDVTVMRYERGIMGSEVQVLRLVAAQTSVPVPEVYYYDQSHALLDSDYYLMAFVPGEAYHKLREQYSEEMRISIDAAIGGYLAQINNIRGTHFGYMALPAQRFESWRQAFLTMFDDLLADGLARQVALPLDYAALRKEVAAIAPVLDEVKTPQLVHWDLWDGNIFVDPPSGRITGIIDFERALWGDPLMEFQYRTLEIAPAFRLGYGRSLLDSPAATARRTLYNLYLHLIMTVECSYRAYETDDQEQWARQQLLADLARLKTLG
jgi:aminoglycoside phosphotransferase (APT) family kinase protein